MRSYVAHTFSFDDRMWRDPPPSSSSTCLLDHPQDSARSGIDWASSALAFHMKRCSLRRSVCLRFSKVVDGVLSLVQVAHDSGMTSGLSLAVLHTELV